jgi:hypothetical protein
VTLDEGLRLAAVITFVVAGILLWADSIKLSTGLALGLFASAAAVAATSPRWRP